jgi:hypothetical protein
MFNVQCSIHNFQCSVFKWQKRPPSIMPLAFSSPGSYTLSTPEVKNAGAHNQPAIPDVSCFCPPGACHAELDEALPRACRRALAPTAFQLPIMSLPCHPEFSSGSALTLKTDNKFQSYLLPKPTKLGVPAPDYYLHKRVSHAKTLHRQAPAETLKVEKPEIAEPVSP